MPRKVLTRWIWHLPIVGKRGCNKTIPKLLGCDVLGAVFRESGLGGFTGFWVKKEHLFLGFKPSREMMGSGFPPISFFPSLLFYGALCAEIPSLGAKVNCSRLIMGEVNRGAGGSRKGMLCSQHPQILLFKAVYSPGTPKPASGGP